VALHGNISAPVQVTDLVEVSKDMASLLVCTWKHFLLGGMQVFCQWRHSGGLLGHLGLLCLALDANRYVVVFCWSFY